MNKHTLCTGRGDGKRKKVLTSNLRAMEESGIVRREAFAEAPPRVEHSLTDLGLTLKPVLDALWAWGESYKAALRGAEE